MHSYVKMSGPKRAQFNVQNLKLFFPVEHEIHSLSNRSSKLGTWLPNPSPAKL